MQVRRLTLEDAAASLALSTQAFGGPAPGPGPFQLTDSRHRWGLFDGGTLAAIASDREFVSLFGGREIPTAGVAAVVVAPEYRGQRLAEQLLLPLLAQARERGAPLASLFRTAPALYRGLGFEEIGAVTTGILPIGALRGLRRPPGVQVRRATAADAATIRTCYLEHARTQCGWFTRVGPELAEPDDQVVADTDGITMAVDDGKVTGYAAWQRGDGFGPTGALTVRELIALDHRALRALLATLASFDTVIGRVRITTTGQDLLPWVVPGAGWEVERVAPYMLRVLDLPAALIARGWPADLSLDVRIEVSDPMCPWNTGVHRLRLGHGTAQVDPEPPGEADITITPTGLAVLYAGAAPIDLLRSGGLVSGPRAHDAQLDRAFAGPRPGVLNSF